MDKVLSYLRAQSYAALVLHGTVPLKWLLLYPAGPEQHMDDSLESGDMGSLTSCRPLVAPMGLLRSVGLRGSGGGIGFNSSLCRHPHPPPRTDLPSCPSSLCPVSRPPTFPFPQKAFSLPGKDNNHQVPISSILPVQRPSTRAHWLWRLDKGYM